MKVSILKLLETMRAITQALQSRLKDLLNLPSEEKAFRFLLFMEANRGRIQRGGLENKTQAVIPEHLSARRIQRTCMVIRDTMVSNHAYEQGCNELEIIERALHQEAKQRTREERARKGPL